MSGDLDDLLRLKPVVLIFLPGVDEAQRFVVSGAFDRLAERYTLHYVVPAGRAREMRAVSAGVLTRSSVSEVPVRREHAEFETELLSELGPIVGAAHDGLSPLPEIVALIAEANPLFCIACTSVPDLFCHHVAWACEQEQVACVVLQSGASDLEGRRVLPPTRPLIAHWGAQAARRAKARQGTHHVSQHVLGIPYAGVLASAGPETVAAVRRELGVTPESCLVLYAGAFPESGEIGSLRRIEEAIENGRLPATTVVYRPHPRSATASHLRAFSRRQLTHVKLDPSVEGRLTPEQTGESESASTTPMSDLSRTAALITSADAVIGPPSSLLVEAMVLNKPTMALWDGPPPEPETTTPRLALFSRLASAEALAWSAKKKGVARDLRHLLKFDKTRHRARVVAVKEMVASGPGTYAERLDELCRRSIEPKAKSRRYKRAGARRGTISHTYGANAIAQRYCGLSTRARLVPGYWMHGWIPEYHNIDPLLVALHKRKAPGHHADFLRQIEEERDTVPQFVSRPDQAEYLRAQGYQKVTAIGLPITYLTARHVSRVPGALLVLPPHGHKSHGPGDPLADRYAEAIADLKPRFSRIVVGLTEDDFVKEEWATAFNRHGVEVVITAQQSDRGTIMRLARILSAFEYVTSNGFGSQLAYAAYCGAKVSIYGPYANFSRERMASIDVLRARPELVDRAVALCSEEALRRHYPFLFVDPDRAVEQSDWGAREVGEPSRMSPGGLTELFGWTSVPSGAGAATSGTSSEGVQRQHR